MLLSSGVSQDRRKDERRAPPSTSVDVTRLEHENLYGQVELMLQNMRRFESELDNHLSRIKRLEEEMDALVRSRSRRF